MAVFNEPQKWAQTLGKDADVTTIPDTAGETDPSIDKIFPAVFSIPLAQGGRAIPRSVLNGLFKLVGDSVYYMQNGGLWSYNSAFDYAVGRVVLYTDGNLYKCIQANSSADPKVPTDSDYWSKIPLLSDFSEFGFNTGDLKPITSNTIPNSWLLGNGATVNRSICPNLVQFAYDNDLVRDSTEQASYESDPANFTGRIYGAGDGSTTIQIPDFRGRSIMGALSSATVGRYQPEQLPNITGQVNVMQGGGAIAYDGAFEFGQPYYPSGTNTSGTQANVLTGFSAHKSNAIYTDSGKVYPLSLALNFIIKA